MKKQAGLILEAIIILLILGLLSAALVHMSMSRAFNSVNVQALNKAHHLAKAAIDEGIYRLIQGTLTCNGATQPTVDMNTGQYRYSCSAYNAASDLNGGINASATTFSVDNGNLFANVGYVKIESEIIYYNNRSGNTFYGVRRGQGGTSAASHSNNRTVTQAQFVIAGEGGSPSFTNPSGLVAIDQALSIIYMFAGDEAGNIYAFDGSSWSIMASFNDAINTMVCPSGTDCWAAGDSGKFYRYNGTEWVQTQDVGNDPIFSLSCLSPTNCRAVGSANNGNSGIIYRYTGSNWSVYTNLGNPILAIDCTSNRCLAGGERGRFYSGNNGYSWYTMNEFFGNGVSIYTLKCFNSNACVAGGSSGRFFRFNGTQQPGQQWTLSQDLGNRSILSIYCLAANNCKAGGGHGTFYSFNGVNWSLEDDVGNRDVYAVSCINANNCQAGGARGLFYSYNGSNWAQIQDVNDDIYAISNPLIPPAIHFITANY